MSGMKATAVAPANIAFIKYWGKANGALRIPLNDSFSMNMSGAHTITTVEFLGDYTRDVITLNPGVSDNANKKNIFSENESNRISSHLDRIRKIANVSLFARIATQNSFPKSSGVASSASGFAALTVAACGALGLNLSEKELTVLARLGSGSACRSIPDGFVVWSAGKTSDTSFAYSLHPSSYWDLRDILVIVDSESKKISTSDGMDAANTSPLLAARLKNISERMATIQDAFKEKDFKKMGDVMEEDCLDMHRVMQTQLPPLYYWNKETEKIIEAVRAWRKNGLSVYFTIDAGSNVHLICEAHSEKEVVAKVRQLSGVQSILINTPAPGAHLINNHLF